jgi:hypothetical protein
MKDERLALCAFTRDEGGRMKDERLALCAFTRDEGGRMKDERSRRIAFHPSSFILLPLLLGAWAVILPVAYTPFIGAEEDLRPLAQPLRELARPGDGVIVGYIWQEGILRAVAFGVGEEYTLGWFTPETVEGQMRDLWAQHERLWLLTYHVPAQDPANAGLWWLESHAARAWSATHGPSRLTLYLRPCAAPPDAPVAAFGDGLTLTHAPLAPPLSPGDTLPLALRWQVTQPLAERYTVFVHLYDAAGKLWAQSDSEPLNGLVAFTQLAPGEAVEDCRALLVPDDAPPGAYFVTVGLYRPDSGERLPLRRGEGWGEQELRLGTVEITVP